MRFFAVVPLALVAASTQGNFAAERPVVDIDPGSSPQQLSEPVGVQRRLFRDGRVFIAGQPDQEALKAFAELGVTAVVNLRIPSEMENREHVPFDEEALVGELGMEYVHIPLGGDGHPYTPAAVDRFADVLARHPGPVLLHCTVAWRASYLWVAYLVRYAELPLDQALARGKAIAIGDSPLEGLLGTQFKLVDAQSPASEPSPRPAEPE